MSGALPRNKLTKSNVVLDYILISQLSSELIRKMTLPTKCALLTLSLPEGYISLLGMNGNEFQ